MSNDNVSVKITADAAGVAPGIDAAKAGVRDLSNDVAAAAARMKEGFTSVGVSVHELGMRIHESVEVVGELREAMMAVAEVYMAAFAVEQIHEFADKMGEAAEKTTHLAETFGMSVGQIQQLSGIAAATGINVEVLTKGMAILDKNMVNSAGSATTAGNALKAVGIAANDGRTQMQLMMSVADKFAQMEDGPKKVALAMALFGKSGKDLIPILNMGAEGLAHFNELSSEYGVVNEAAVEKGYALADAMDEQKLAMMGVSNVLTDALAPMLTEAADGLNSLIKGFVDSYREGGLVRDIFEGIAGAAEGAGAIISEFGSTCSGTAAIVKQAVNDIGSTFDENFGKKVPEDTLEAADLMATFRADIILAKDTVLSTVTLMAATLDQFVQKIGRYGPIIYDALSGNWDRIAADWQAGEDRIEANARSWASRMKAIAADMKSAFDVSTGAADPAHTAQGDAEIKGLLAPGRPKGEGGDLGFHGGGGHQKKPKDDAVQKWETELTAQKTAFEVMQRQQGTYENFSIADEVKFWAQKIDLTAVGSKDRGEVERKWLAALDALRKQDNAAAVEAIKNREQIELEGARHVAETAKIGLQTKIDAIDSAEKAGVLSTAKAIAARNDLNQQLLQLDINLAVAEKAAKLSALNAQLQDEKLTSAQIKAINDQILLVTKAADDKIVQLNDQKNKAILKGNQDLARQQNQWFQTMAQGFGSAIGKMVTFQQGFAGTVRSIFQSLQNVVANAIANMVTNWITGHVNMAAISKLFGVKDIAVKATQAEAGAYAATTPIPFVGPALAPGIAAAALAAVLAFSARGGWGDVPYDGAMTELHKNEMVLPADIAVPLRQSLKSGGGAPIAVNDTGGALGGGGATHIHIHAMDSRDVARFMRDNGRHVAAGVKRAVRDGYRG